MSQIVIKPIITEKMTATTEDMNRYGFIVKNDANKIQIKDAVEKLYGVNVEKVWTMRYAGKSKSRFTKTGLITGKSGAYKKAMISIADGETIDLYSNI
ncbi:50S ribosomal protein L23 [Cryomorpha ignava]|uniref:Large ribosomal subunit protein uL23 n=1 Tax=Cryomorpha ignava TaxID=101383 RepID=A0A7K3WP72_9FLAO|nr:50S ribosomal protein L23 [Cryomorpha ignava]NEN23450.1 50S ribosomal protein L23 [Cryomorpha ignava]